MLLAPLRLLRNSFSSNADRRLAALKTFADWLFDDYRLTWSQMDWWDDQWFNEFLRGPLGTGQTFNTHRRWMLYQLTKLVRDVPGDTAECGVSFGASSWLICQLGRQHHAFDSFEGLSESGPEDGHYWQPGVFSVPEEVVQRNLSGYEVKTYKGWIPERFQEVADRTFAFVHVDVDLYQPTRDSIEFFYPRLSPRGVLVCDDYGCTTCPGSTKAIDEFMAHKPELVLSLDAGGCFFIKRAPVEG